MHRHRGRHQRRRPWNALARSGLLVTVVGTATVLIFLLAGGDADESAHAGEASSSTHAVGLRPGSLPGSDVVDRGVVRGTLSLHTDVPPHPHTWVAYLIDGPTSTIRFASRAPYRADVDTRQLPDGPYTVDEVIFQSAAAPRVTTTRVLVDNGGGGGGGGGGGAARPVESAPAAEQPPAAESGPESAASNPPSPAAAAPTQRPPASAAPPAAPPPTSPAGPPTAAAPGEGMAAQVVELTNVERAKAGCAPLAVDPRLAAAALAHSADMARADYFNHDSQGGQTPFERIVAAGYTFSVAAENIAAGQRTPQDVVAGWMNSAGHRTNILNCSLMHIGVGYATGGSYGIYWTQDFGTP